MPADGSSFCSSSTSFPSFSSSAPSLAFVWAVCAFQDAAVESMPFSSVMARWRSPVVADVTRKGTPASRAMVWPSTLLNEKSPLITRFAQASPSPERSTT